MNSKIFSFKVDGIVLEPANDSLKVSQNFDRKIILEQLNARFKEDNFKLDERTLNFKIKDDQLFIEGLVVESEEPKSIGFLFGK